MKKLKKWVKSLGHGLRNQIQKIKARRKDIMKRLEESRDKRDRIRKTFNTMKRHPNESTKEWQRRRANKKKFLENEKRNVEVLGKKAAFLHEKVDHKAKKLEQHIDANNYDSRGSNIVSFDGVSVTEWIAYWLKKTRDAGCSFSVISGYRTPEYSQSLCYNICGAPSCPGTCAGASSNHSGRVYPAGAVDISYANYASFEATQFRIGSPLRNDLPNDPNHFSVSGH